MRSPLLSYRALLVLYGVSALVLLPFGFGYAYACLHGWDRLGSLTTFLVLGVIAALSVWALLGPRGFAGPPTEVSRKGGHYLSAINRS